MSILVALICLFLIIFFTVFLHQKDKIKRLKDENKKIKGVIIGKDYVIKKEFDAKSNQDKYFGLSDDELNSLHDKARNLRD